MRNFLLPMSKDRKEKYICSVKHLRQRKIFSYLASYLQINQMPVSATDFLHKNVDCFEKLKTELNYLLSTKV